MNKKRGNDMDMLFFQNVRVVILEGFIKSWVPLQKLYRDFWGLGLGSHKSHGTCFRVAIMRIILFRVYIGVPLFPEATICHWLYLFQTTTTYISLQSYFFIGETGGRGQMRAFRFHYYFYARSYSCFYDYYFSQSMLHITTVTAVRMREV